MPPLRVISPVPVPVSAERHVVLPLKMAFAMPMPEAGIQRPRPAAKLDRAGAGVELAPTSVLPPEKSGVLP